MVKTAKEAIEVIKKSIEGEEPQTKKQEAIEKLNEKAGIKKDIDTPFILDPNKLPQRLNHALGKIKINGEFYRYYGAKISEWKKKIINKGKKTEREVMFPELSEVMVLEDGQIISKSTKPKGLSFEFDSIMTLKTNRWSLNSIKDFCNGTSNIPTFKETYNSFKKHYDSSMVYENDTWYKFDAIWDLTTYFWDVIDKFLIIKHEGISGTAKSKGMKISVNLSFNGKKFLCPTPANFFRYRHNNKAVLYIEEAEKLFDQSKKQNQGDAELVEYLNGSYEKGNTVPRQNDKNINQTDEFDPAGFTRIGSIAELRGALQQRSLPKHMVKAPASDKRGNVEVPAENDIDYSNSRDKAYICGLLFYKEYGKALEEVKNNYGLANRQWVLAKPLIATAKCISAELEKEIGDFIAKGFERRDSNFDEKSWERILANLLIDIYCTKEKSEFLSTEDIKAVFIPKVDRTYRVTSIKIGMIMNKLGLSEFKKSTGEKRGFEMTFEKLCEILIRQGWTNKENIKKRCQGCQGCKFTSKMIELLCDNLLTPYTPEPNNTDNLTPFTPLLEPQSIVKEVKDANP